MSSLLFDKDSISIDNCMNNCQKNSYLKCESFLLHVYMLHACFLSSSIFLPMFEFS